MALPSVVTPCPVQPANAVLDVIDSEGLEARALELGERIQNGLRDALGRAQRY
jgi:4-aminobutyrate aminotransferase-like enzyme